MLRRTARPSMRHKTGTRSRTERDGELSILQSTARNGQRVSKYREAYLWSFPSGYQDQDGRGPWGAGDDAPSMYRAWTGAQGEPGQVGSRVVQRDDPEGSPIFSSSFWAIGETLSWAASE